MRDIDFFSESNYLSLPTSKKPKVLLAIDDDGISKNSFKLYNPFSFKAKILKTISQFFCVKANKFSQNIIPTIKKEKSEFINYLESKLNKPLVVSVYFATAKDKVVLQLQSNHKIIGYLKYPLNKNGIDHLNNEYKAIEILSKKNIVESVILYDYFNEVPYLFLKELEGDIKKVQNQDLEILLQKFKKQQKYQLKNHPRVLQLQVKLKENDLIEYAEILKNSCDLSQESYFEVYEHGDFAPWNIIESKNKYIPFDFEYFEENGLEYLDLIKYYYQLGYLLNKFSKKELIDFICNKVELIEINILIQVFLIKEILRKKEENEPYSYENELLKYMYNGV